MSLVELSPLVNPRHRCDRLLLRFGALGDSPAHNHIKQEYLIVEHARPTSKVGRLSSAREVGFIELEIGAIVDISIVAVATSSLVTSREGIPDS